VATELFLASSNAGKLAEYKILARDALKQTGRKLELHLDLLPNFSQLPTFEENEPTFGENAAGKALHYSRLSGKMVFADDSGLVVPALGGAPGVRSARYAGADASDAEKIAKLLGELRCKQGQPRSAYFVCVIALAINGTAKAIVSAQANGEITEQERGSQGFGYDPVFFFPPLKKTFAELSVEEKNLHSHRGKAFQRLIATLPDA